MSVKKFMKECGYSGYIVDAGIRKDYKRRSDWNFKTLEEVLKEYKAWQRKQDASSAS